MKTSKRMGIWPLEGVGDILFGKEKAEILSKLGVPLRTFMRSKESEAAVDDFGWCHVLYNPQGIVEAVEFFNDGTVALSFQEKNLFSLCFDDLAKTLQEHDDEAEFTPPDIVSKKLGIAAYGEDGKTVSIIVSTKGYLK